MPVFKYVSEESALRYIETWSLRITPPNQFNDPFEFRPKFKLFTKEKLNAIAPNSFRSAVKDIILSKIKDAGRMDEFDESRIDQIVGYLLHELNSEDEREFIDLAEKQNGPGAFGQLLAMRQFIEEARRKTITDLEENIPQLNNNFEIALHSAAHRAIGVLCLSGSGRNLLMWSHYADSHQGALLEFNEQHETFKRQRSDIDECGFLRRVIYSDTRPELGPNTGDGDFFTQLALTKGLEWSYEQELRLLLPLNIADKTISTNRGEIHLIDAPPSAVKSITFGCKSSDAFIKDATATLGRTAGTAHINIKRSHIDTTHYSLVYREIDQP